MMVQTTNTCKDRAKPRLVCKYSPIEFADYSNDAILPENRIKLPKLNGLSGIL